MGMLVSRRRCLKTEAGSASAMAAGPLSKRSGKALFRTWALAGGSGRPSVVQLSKAALLGKRVEGLLGPLSCLIASLLARIGFTGRPTFFCFSRTALL
ncbi:hypothetical protein [Kitasatospora cineracea]|uniref:Uncharacterized protein n=1 Tax=Kitasatospora cineracea TaxID=88074 RepID=A0A8G1UM21_9ACTN|nr:hypothetical protein [Kitasatospora cineracea]ROR46508.1 hypothetical protein EDD39_4783 [Kitasatospora cineracea]